MALLAPKVGAEQLSKVLVNNVAPTNVKLHLYTNNHTPAEGDVLGSYTESTAAGYAAAVLTGASWTITAGSSAGAVASYPQVTFTYTAAETVYGYYVTDNSSLILLWAELFTGGPFVVPSAGGTIQVTPGFTLQ